MTFVKVSRIHEALSAIVLLWLYGFGLLFFGRLEADPQHEQRDDSLIVECQDIDNGKMCQHIANKVL